MRIEPEELSAISSYEEYDDYLERLRKNASPDAVSELLSIALGSSRSAANIPASRLFVALDPEPNNDLSHYLERIASSRWDLSDRLIPFYLVSRFGKNNVVSEIESFLRRADLDANERTLVEGIKYWLGLPSLELVFDDFQWEWFE